MDSRRSDRLGDLLLELLSQLLSKEVNDPRIGAVTLTRAELSRDLRHARIYFNLLTEEKDRKEVSAGLKSATGFIRARVAKGLRLRFVPTIEFVYDEAPDQAQRIEDLLRQVKKDR